MRYKLLANLGTDAAGQCGLSADKSKEGSVVNIDEDAAAILLKKYPGLMEAVDTPVKAVAKEPAIKAPTPEDFSKPPRAHDK